MWFGSHPMVAVADDPERVTLTDLKLLDVLVDPVQNVLRARTSRLGVSSTRNWIRVDSKKSKYCRTAYLSSDAMTTRLASRTGFALRSRGRFFLIPRSVDRALDHVHQLLRVADERNAAEPPL